MIKLIDQMNQTIRLEKIPERIVSLVPSQTELLFDLGLGDRVVGITKFCIHPDEWFKNKQRVGGTKNLNHDIIKKLKPDLIIGNKEENSESDISLLQKYFPVYMSDIFTVSDACKMITDVGEMTGTIDLTSKMVREIETDFSDFPKAKGSVLYLIWANPFMAAGNNTFIGDIIKKFGLTNVLNEKNLRYVELTNEQISELNPDYIFLSSEPFPFNESHANKLAVISNAKIHFTDGELLSWYGSRMLKMKDYFIQLFHRIKRA